MSVQRKSVQCLSPAGLHRVSYKEWGDPRNPRVLLCVHGVTRVADDFDALAAVMADSYRVICPDIVGRGQSDWLRNPQFYQIPQYVSDMVTLLARLDVETVDWFGTSMGGLIGMGMAALADNPIRKLILNDVGPVLNPAAIARIADYIAQDMRFASFEEGAAYIRMVSASFGPHTEAQWHKLATDVLRQNHEGQWIRHYDLNLSIPIKATTPEMALAGQTALWATYDAIKCQTLVIRGAESDLLSAETALEMQQRGPHAKVVELPGVGHAPTFVQPEQIAIAREFLLS
ncbi:alpha/beta hydrolase [Undibacterium sp. Jales W-56]|uniref:alpha/beta fold hydrolase n=1 Tax=Undibacterium sp. Jales W-56 TaxID=2897325 RepID=UPI0021D1430B|nr:alpha/beta hydrolase [Undibacterium sp. Jales W-56]MCU6433086.1 alpha/beta hydrolase [Undibacterium sp. Jales W-56]